MTLSSNNAAAQVPANVTVPAGNTSATFSVSTLAVASNSTVTITATLATAHSAALTISAPTVTGLSLSASSVYGGSGVTGTLTLGSPAPTGGMTIDLANDNPAAAQAPAAVTVPGGATSATFTVTASLVTADAVADISAGNGAQSATLNVTPLLLIGLDLSPDSVPDGDPATGTVTLNGPAPAGGLSIALQIGLGPEFDAQSAASVPATVTVAVSQTQATFTITTYQVGWYGVLFVGASFQGTQIYGLIGLTEPPVSAISLGAEQRHRRNFRHRHHHAGQPGAGLRDEHYAHLR